MFEDLSACILLFNLSRHVTTPTNKKKLYEILFALYGEERVYFNPLILTILV